jgi:hypothetical protein
MEAVGNLDNVSARAATLIVGGLKIAGAMSGPTRRIALVPAEAMMIKSGRVGNTISA